MDSCKWVPPQPFEPLAHDPTSSSSSSDSEEEGGHSGKKVWVEDYTKVCSRPDTPPTPPSSLSPSHRLVRERIGLTCTFSLSLSLSLFFIYFFISYSSFGVFCNYDTHMQIYNSVFLVVFLLLIDQFVCFVEYEFLVCLLLEKRNRKVLVGN